MAKLKTSKVEITNEVGQKETFTSTITVNDEGVFSVTFPHQFIECVKSCSHASGCRIYKNPTNACIQGTNLKLCQEIIADGVKAYISVKVESKIVIRYHHSCRFSAWRDSDGKLWPNGYLDPNQNGKGNWVDGGNTNSANPTDQFMFGLGAGLYEKITYTRGAVVTHEYKKVDVIHVTEGLVGDFGELLSGFNNLHVNERCHPKEMPYTEKAAQFFYNALIGLAAMATQFDEFFKNDLSITDAIELGKVPLIGE